MGLYIVVSHSVIGSDRPISTSQQYCTEEKTQRSCTEKISAFWRTPLSGSVLLLENRKTRTQKENRIVFVNRIFWGTGPARP